MNDETRTHAARLHMWGGGKNEAIKAFLTKKRKTIPTHLGLVVFLLLLAYTATTQTISFTLSKDSVQSFEDLILTNTSVDLPDGTVFRWEFSGSYSLIIDSLIHHKDSTTMMIAFDKNDSQFVVSPGFPSKLFRDSLYITLIATDSNGIQLSVPVYSKIIIIYLNYPFPLYPCSDLNNDPCHSIVCNGSFEDIGGFTGGPQGLINAVPWFGVDAEVFNNGFASAFGVPNNMFGSQLANTGNTYGGFHPRYTSDITKPNFPKSEVISTMLKYSLDQNQTYQVTFQTSLADRSNLATRLNAYLDIQPPFLTIHTGDHLQSAMVNNPNGVVQNGLGYITNVTQFVPVTGVFTPAQTGVYRLYIGSPDNMDVTSASGNWGANPIPGYPPTDYLAYYYIDDVEVVPLPATVVVEGYQDPVNCRLYHLSTSKPQNVASYQWSINGVPVINAIQSSVTLSNPLHLPIQCIVTNFHGCESVYTWEPDPCNLLQNSDISIKNVKVSDLTDPQSSIFQHLSFNGNHYELDAGSMVVYIHGTLTIDQDFTFLNCENLVMGPNAKIVVEPNLTPGISLTIFNCTIYSCNFDCFMWDGIYATDPNSSVLINESTISHAKNAVYSRNNPELDIHGNTFSNNLIGIHLTNHKRDCSAIFPGQNPIPPIPANVNLVSNTFQGDLSSNQYISQYLPGFDGMEWGIRVDTVDLLTIGQGNNFRELSCGIHINTGNVLVQSNTFELIAHHTNTPGVNEPFGHLTSSLYKEGAIVINKILPSGSGFPAGNPSSSECVPEYVKVEDNLFEDCRIGVYAWYIPLEIRENNFINIKYNALRGQSLLSAIVDGNNHYYTAIQQLVPNNNVFNYEYYIAQANQNGNLGYNISIQNNEILTYKSGISLTNATSTGASQINPKRWVLVENNKIYLDDLPSNPNREGIRLNACDRARVFGNTIANIDPIQYPSVQNVLPNLHGIHVSQTKDAWVYDNFTIKRFGKGIYNIGYNAGTQFQCNKLEENYYGFFCELSTAGSNTFVVDQLTSGNENRNSFVGNVNLRINNMSGGPFNWYYTGANVSSNPTAPYLFYGINPVLGNTINPPCGTFPDNMVNPSVREELFGIIVRDGDTLYGALQDEFSWYADEYLYKSFYWNSDWMYMGISEDSVYQHFYNFFDNEAILSFTQIEELIEMGELEQALWNNDNVVAQTLIEFNQQLVNEIYLETWAQGIEPDSNQVALLEAVALLTPYVGGNAVYTARVMLDIDPFNYGLPYRMAQDKGEDVTLHVIFYPNPAGSLLFLEFLEPVEGTGTFEMFDVQGRKVLAQHFRELPSLLSIDTSPMKDGLYFARFQLSNGHFAAQKIVVKH